MYEFGVLGAIQEAGGSELQGRASGVETMNERRHPDRGRRSGDRLAELLTAVVVPVAESRPRSRSTSITPEQVDMVLAARRALADLLTGEGAWDELAERLDELADECRRQVVLEAAGGE
jgi:hypothetical protein